MTKKGEYIGLTARQTELSAEDPIDPLLLQEGFEMIQAEKKMGFREAMRHHWRAAAWSFLLSWALVMEGYDCLLASPKSSALLSDR